MVFLNEVPTLSLLAGKTKTGRKSEGALLWSINARLRRWNLEITYMKLERHLPFFQSTKSFWSTKEVGHKVQSGPFDLKLRLNLFAPFPHLPLDQRLWVVRDSWS